MWWGRAALRRCTSLGRDRACSRRRTADLRAASLAALAGRSGIEVSFGSAEGVGRLNLLRPLHLILEVGPILIATVLKFSTVLRLWWRVEPILGLGVRAILEVRTVLGSALALLHLRRAVVSLGIVLATTEVVVAGIVVVNIAVQHFVVDVVVRAIVTIVLCVRIVVEPRVAVAFSMSDFSDGSPLRRLRRPEYIRPENG